MGLEEHAASTRSYSYMLTGEYDMLEFDFANVVNYSDLANLMAPRPFMVERGHDDGVAPDEWVAYEYAKVRRFYTTRMGMPDRTEIEFFNGPHTINGQGTFEFLAAAPAVARVKELGGPMERIRFLAASSGRGASSSEGLRTRLARPGAVPRLRRNSCRDRNA